MNISNLINSKVEKVDKILKEINTLRDKIGNIFAKDRNSDLEKIDEGIDHLTKMSKINYKENNIKNILESYTNVKTYDFILDIIHSSFRRILDKNINVETFLSQTYINETREYSEKVAVLFGKTNKALNEINHKITEYYVSLIKKEVFDEMSNLINDYPLVLDLYIKVANKIVDETPDAVILDNVEVVKNHIFGKYEIHKFNSNNNFIKNFGLINKKIQNIPEIISHIFKLSSPKAKKKELISLCKKNNYDLIIIKEMLNRGIKYNLEELLDYDKSKEFISHSSPDDGITPEFIDRYSTIDFITDKYSKWNLDYIYEYEDEKNEFCLILTELSPELYCISVNRLEGGNFIRKSLIPELLQFVRTKKYSTRADKYNSILNKKIINNMFLNTKPDVERLKAQAQMTNPKFVRYEIYMAVLEEFKKRIAKKKIKTPYDINELFHAEEYKTIFSQTIIREYNKVLYKDINIFESENISISEIYSSFLPVLNIYERDFVKVLHDLFVLKKISPDSSKEEITELFDSILDESLNNVMTNDNNLFQSIAYKTYLFKLSLLD
jgi:hypothetical protein